jgi:hypothetical protein
VSAYRRISQLHENTRLIQFGATPAGRVLIWVAATGLLWHDFAVAAIVSPVIAMLLLFPDRRRAILAVGALIAYFSIAMGYGLSEPGPLIAGMAATLSVSYLFFRMSLKFDKLPPLFQRFPLLLAHWPMLFFAGVALSYRAIEGPLRVDPIHMAALSMMTFLAWRWSYLLFSGRRGSVKGTRFADHLFYILPLFGGSNTPYGKGYDHLSQQKQTTGLDVSKAQLAGLKLLVLLHLWRWFSRIVNSSLAQADGGIIQRLLGEPGIDRMLVSSQIVSDMPGDIALSTAWAMLFVSLVMKVVWLAIYGHLIVGCLRLFGFNVYRNTYKPLLSESLVQYWNRYYYYFKELLVDFFFYPTYAACSKFPPLVRLFFSTMAAAFLGNIYYHFFRDIELYLLSSNEEWVSILLSRSLYSFVLGLGIFVSLRREAKRRRRKEPDRSIVFQLLIRTRRILGVWLFFGLLIVWVAGPDTTPFANRLAFFLALFGIH